MKNETKNTKQNAPTSDELDKEFASYEEEQIGFPPYWIPQTGKRFLATVVDVDMRDPEFQRYTLQASCTLACHRGPKDAREDVIVKKGDYFTCSAYASLPLHQYVGHEVLVYVKGQQDIGRPNPMWVFGIKVSAQVRLLLEAARAEKAKALPAHMAT